MTKSIHVAVGVIEDTEGRILIARRPAHLHQGGLWEFPGGKVEPGEHVTEALRRELQEELGIMVTQSQPFLLLEHDYGDKQVMLDVHRVLHFEGEARGHEGQPIAWVSKPALRDYTFPVANQRILNSLSLPNRYMITGEFSDASVYSNVIVSAIENGIRLIQLRAKTLDESEYLSLARQLLQYQSATVSLILNTSVEVFRQTEAAGLHLTSSRLMQLSQRPIPTEKLLSVSVHNGPELLQANRIGADCVLISPVARTASHPDAAALGWPRFRELCRQAQSPVYALGGMKLSDISRAQENGAQGIAGITGICGEP